jgi:hypothetical protein
VVVQPNGHPHKHTGHLFLPTLPRSKHAPGLAVQASQ